MYKSLWIIDNAMAKKIHPLDSRKIQRFILILFIFICKIVYLEICTLDNI